MAAPLFIFGNDAGSFDSDTRFNMDRNFALVNGWAFVLSDGDGVIDDGPAFRAALASGAHTVYVRDPRVAYTIASGTIPVADGQRLVGSGDSTCKINVTANAGSTASANSLFQLSGNGSWDGFNVIYPTQCLSDTVGAIISYPPTFLLNNSNVGSIKNGHFKGAYDLFRQDAGSFANLTLQNLYSVSIHSGGSFVGHMGDVSVGDNVQIILFNPNVGFNGGPVDLWCRVNSFGWNFAPVGGNRIDLFRFTNSGIVGGAKACIGGGNGLVWMDWDNWHSDITSQSFVGQFSNLVLSNGWVSQMDAFYSAPHTPAMQFSAASKVKMTNVEMSLQASGSSCPIVGSTSLDLAMSNVRLSTSRAYFTPAVYCDFGLTLSASGCSTTTSNGTKPLAFSDVSTFDLVGVTLDGKRAFGKFGTDLGPANFSMTTWAAGAPTGWTTNLGTPANFIRQLAGPGIEIFPSPAASGSFYLEYILPNAGSGHLFGHYQVTSQITLIDATGNAVIGTVEWAIGNPTDGWNYGAPVMGNGNAGAECSGLPLGPLYTGTLLSAPLNPTDNLAIRLFCNFPSGVNLLKIQMTAIQIWTVLASANPAAENSSGTEFIRPGVGSGQVRDTILGGFRSLRRLTVPLAFTTIQGDRVIRNPPVVGQPKAWVATGATVGTFTSEGNL